MNRAKTNQAKPNRAKPNQAKPSQAENHAKPSQTENRAKTENQAKPRIRQKRIRPKRNRRTKSGQTESGQSESGQKRIRPKRIRPKRIRPERIRPERLEPRLIRALGHVSSHVGDHAIFSRCFMAKNGFAPRKNPARIFTPIRIEVICFRRIQPEFIRRFASKRQTQFVLKNQNSHANSY